MEQQPVQLHMEQFTFKLADFEGPLDLLLYLVSKNKMSLADIEIVKLHRSICLHRARCARRRDGECQRVH